GHFHRGEGDADVVLGDQHAEVIPRHDEVPHGRDRRTVPGNEAGRRRAAIDHPAGTAVDDRGDRARVRSEYVAQGGAIQNATAITEEEIAPSWRVSRRPRTQVINAHDLVAGDSGDPALVVADGDRPYGGCAQWREPQLGTAAGVER